MQLLAPAPGSPSGASDSRCWWWQEAATQAAPEPPLTEDTSADVVIVGGGYAGLWAALAVLEREPRADVLVVEARTCGSGASGRNGGALSGYWHSHAKLSRLVGPVAARELGELGEEAQHAVLELCRSQGVPHAEHPMIMAATTPAQVAHVHAAVRHTAPQVPDAHRPRPVTAGELHAMTGNPALQHGAALPGAATVQPARLGLAIKQAVLDAGARIVEHTPVLRVDPRTSEVHTRGGQVISAGSVILAANAWQSSLPRVRRLTTNMSSHVLVTEPVPHIFDDLSWPEGLFLRDARTFLHWTRRTDDDRLIVGTGAGPLSAAGRVTRRQEHPTPERLRRALARFVPQAADAAVDACWGGAIDLSCDTVPYVATYPGTQVSFVTGFSGHGVNASWLAAQALASLVTGRRDRWTTSALCTRSPGALPPEPIRYLGALPIHRSSIGYEDQLDDEGKASRYARTIAAVPELLGIRLGVR